MEQNKLAMGQRFFYPDGDQHHEYGFKAGFGGFVKSSKFGFVEMLVDIRQFQF